MPLRNYLKILKKTLLVSSLFLLTACASDEKIIVQTEIIQTEIPTQARPKGVSLSNVRFYVVTKENLNDFLKNFEKENDDTVFYAISVKDYEKMALNIADLRRYINQQDKLILYYEKAVKKPETKPEKQ
jgi:lipopolysaccharide export LptBFGC system permease protein LptF